MIATAAGAILTAIGVIWGVAELGPEDALIFLLPGIALLVVGLILQSNAKTRRELMGIRLQLEALGRTRRQPEK
ncbi:hypothetical protein [Isoptericola sp. G70]|uniref:hypothetical protein n=1 Tax=Isoptericola sp. G70 TaxID=3376633 RepID=UPI003A807E08